MVKSLDHHWEKPSNATDADPAKQIQLLEEEVSVDVAQPDLDEKQPLEDEPGRGVNGRGKALLSTYEPDKRVESWLKVKKDYIEGVGDSLDLVPIGGTLCSVVMSSTHCFLGWHGMGRKAAWWSPVLLAVYDAENDEYQAVCKCISGFTDAEYKSIKFER